MQYSNKLSYQETNKIISPTTPTKMLIFFNFFNNFTNEFVKIASPFIAFFALIATVLALAPSLFQGQIAKLGIKLNHSDKITTWLGDTLKVLVELRLLFTNNQLAYEAKKISLLSNLHTQAYLYTIHAHILDANPNVDTNNLSTPKEDDDIVISILMMYFHKLSGKDESIQEQYLHKLEMLLVQIVTSIINNEGIMADKKTYFQTHFEHKIALGKYLKARPEYEYLFR